VAWPILGCQKAQKIRENSALFGNPDEASIQQVAMPASSLRIWQYSSPVALEIPILNVRSARVARHERTK